MRQTFIRSEPLSPEEFGLVAYTMAEAEQAAPWAAEIIPCEGGFMAFESVADAATWKAQI